MKKTIFWLICVALLILCIYWKYSMQRDKVADQIELYKEATIALKKATASEEVDSISTLVILKSKDIRKSMGKGLLVHLEEERKACDDYQYALREATFRVNAKSSVNLQNQIDSMIQAKIDSMKTH